MLDEILTILVLQNFYRYGPQDTIYPVRQTPSLVRIRITNSTERSLFVLCQMRNVLISRCSRVSAMFTARCGCVRCVCCVCFVLFVAGLAPGRCDCCYGDDGRGVRRPVHFVWRSSCQYLSSLWLVVSSWQAQLYAVVCPLPTVSVATSALGLMPLVQKQLGKSS